jgi:hypothetical protein
MAVMPQVAAAPTAPSDDPVDYDAVTGTILGDLPAGLASDQREELRLLVAEVARIGFEWARGQPGDVRVVWVREPAPGGGRIVDVVTEGSSLTRNYAAQIRKLMRDPTKGYAFVVERLRRKIARSS